MQACIERMRAAVKIQWCISAVLLLASAHAAAGMFTSDGNTFEECMENRIDETKTEVQYGIAAQYCRQKHPAPVVHLDIPDPWAHGVPQLRVVVGTDTEYAKARPVIAAVALTHVTITSDSQSWYSRVDITNRNRFPLSALIVGFAARGVNQCDWNPKSYTEIYECDGSADSGMSGSFRCNIPGVEQRTDAHYCIIGIGVTATPDDLKRYSLTK